eukprot:GFUD01096134.1.p1 GENE.GFUD01096134.1~~GFUD01096134.1.p1  ORF type:complete len:179 (-),score=39.67 GFUD01096134.1:33-536(-)
MELILSFIDSDQQVEELCKKALIMAVVSDKPECVEILIDHVVGVPDNVVAEAIKRNNNEIIEIIKNVSDNPLLRNRGTNQAKKELEEIRAAFLNGTECELINEGDPSILKIIPKSEEWEYDDEFKHFDSNLDERNNLSIKRGIDKFHVAPVHFGICKPNKFIYAEKL